MNNLIPPLPQFLNQQYVPPYVEEIIENDEGIYENVLKMRDNVTDLKNKYKKIKEEKAQTDAEAAALKRNNEDLTAENERLNVEKEGIEIELNRLKSQTGPEGEVSGADHAKLLADYEALKAEHAAHVRAHEEMKAEHLTLKDLHEMKDAELQKVLVDYEELKAEHDARVKAHEELQAANRSLNEVHATKDADLAKLLADYEELQAEHDARVKAHEEMAEEHITLKADHQALKDLHKMKDADLKRLLNDLETLKAEHKIAEKRMQEVLMEEIRKITAEFQEQLTTLEEELKDAKEENQRLLSRTDPTSSDSDRLLIANLKKNNQIANEKMVAIADALNLDVSAADISGKHQLIISKIKELIENGEQLRQTNEQLSADYGRLRKEHSELVEARKKMKEDYGVQITSFETQIAQKNNDIKEARENLEKETHRHNYSLIKFLATKKHELIKAEKKFYFSKDDGNWDKCIDIVIGAKKAIDDYRQISSIPLIDGDNEDLENLFITKYGEFNCGTKKNKNIMKTAQEHWDESESMKYEKRRNPS